MNFIEKNTKKVAVILGLATAISAISTVYAAEHTDGWHGFGANRTFKDNGETKVNTWVYQPEGTYYVNANGHPVIRQWMTINGSLYYFDKDGKKVSGKQYIDGYMYTFQKSGVLLTGWNNEKNMYYDVYGDFTKGVQSIDGTMYHFNDDGKLQSGWKLLGDNTVYFTDKGVLASGEVSIAGKMYNFTNNGTIMNGWQIADGEKFYYNEFGYMVKGWQTIDAKKYYFNKHGQAATNTEYEGYTFDANGVAQPIVKPTAAIRTASKGSTAASIASAQIGRSYVFGGTTPAGFDCSGLTSYAYAQVGITIPRTAGAQGTIGTAVAYSDMLPGDLIVWDYGAHVGIYTGNGRMTHSANPSTGVLSSSISYWSINSGQTITAIRRP